MNSYHEEELEETGNDASTDVGTDNYYGAQLEGVGSNSTLSVEQGSEVKKLRLWPGWSKKKQEIRMNSEQILSGYHFAIVAILAGDIGNLVG